MPQDFRYAPSHSLRALPMPTPWKSGRTTVRCSRQTPAWWFEQGATADVDALLIHELGHEFSGDHLSSDYHEALCKLGADLKKLALERRKAMRFFLR